MTPGFVPQLGTRNAGDAGCRPTSPRSCLQIALVVDGAATLRLGLRRRLLLGVERVIKASARGPAIHPLWDRNAEAGGEHVTRRRVQPCRRPPTRSREYRPCVDASRAPWTTSPSWAWPANLTRQDGFIDNTTTGRAEDDRQSASGRSRVVSALDAGAPAPMPRQPQPARARRRRLPVGADGCSRETVRSGTETAGTDPRPA